VISKTKMAEEDKELSEPDKMGLLALSARSLEDYFSLLESNRSEADIAKEFDIDGGKPLTLNQLLGDFTYCLLGDKKLSNWKSVVYLETIDESKKYALNKIGKIKTDEKYGSTKEERGFNYVKGKLRHVNNAMRGSSKEKKEACMQLNKFFRFIAEISEKDIEWM
jgi:hypothetical protein